MKEAVILVVLAVVVVGGIGIWLSNGNSIPFFGSQPPAAQPDAQQTAEPAKGPTPEKPLKAKAAKSATKKTPSVPVVEVAPVVAAPVAEVVVAPPARPAPKQFPAANEIVVGAARENIAEKFGQPALTTTTSDDGRVMENLVYARKSGRDMTVIRIENGKVLSAYSR